MILTPFKIVYELIVFGLQAAFLYGLALIIAIGFIAYAIAQHPKKEWNPKQERIEYVKVAFPKVEILEEHECISCLLYTSPSPRDRQKSRMPSSA